MINVRDSFGKPRPLVVHVHDGDIYTLIEGVQTKQAPAEVERVRQVLLDAMALALRQRGGSWE